MGAFSKLESFHQDEKRHRFEQIIRNSPALEAVLGGVQRGAPTTSTVSIEGEIGKGTELIAKAIHNISPRCGRPFIKVNCAAIHFDLLESEIFGYEKGAFTGTIAQWIGRLELTGQGTLFRDEVGDIPPCLQPKLLRVLQEQEFERLGSTHTQCVDVRVVAATHRNLTRIGERLGMKRTSLIWKMRKPRINRTATAPQKCSPNTMSIAPTVPLSSASSSRKQL